MFDRLRVAVPLLHKKRGLERVREEYNGVWYWWADNEEGWLCPALFLYFPEPPTRLYAKAEAL